VTPTDPKLFQAPYLAGHRIDAYQLEPLRKALLLARDSGAPREVSTCPESLTFEAC
jgi:hypothetical protein